MHQISLLWNKLNLPLATPKRATPLCRGPVLMLGSKFQKGSYIFHRTKGFFVRPNSQTIIFGVTVIGDIAPKFVGS